MAKGIGLKEPIPYGANVFNVTLPKPKGTRM